MPELNKIKQQIDSAIRFKQPVSTEFLQEINTTLTSMENEIERLKDAVEAHRIREILT